MKLAAKGDPLARAMNPEVKKPMPVGKFEIPKIKQRSRWVLDFNSVEDELREYIQRENVDKKRSLYDIALSDMNIYRSQLKSALDRLKIPHYNSHGTRLREDERKEVEREVISDAILGVVMLDTAERLGVSFSTVKRARVENNEIIQRYRKQAAEAFKSEQG